MTVVVLPLTVSWIKILVCTGIEPVLNWTVYLRVDHRRVVCTRCGVRSERLALMDRCSRFAERFERMVFRPLCTINRFGANEICYGRKKNLYTIVSDLENSSVIGMIEGNQTIALNSFFEIAGKSFCEAVNVVCMDMWKAFHTSVETFCINAKIIFDKFHLIRHLNDAIDEIRRKEFFRQRWRETGTGTWEAMAVPSRWFNLIKDQKGLLKETLSLNKRLCTAYYLKEIFGFLWLKAVRGH